MTDPIQAYLNSMRRALFRNDTESGIVSGAGYSSRCVAPSGNEVERWYVGLEGGKRYSGCLGFPVYIGPDQNELRGSPVLVDQWKVFGIPLVTRVRKTKRGETL